MFLFASNLLTLIFSYTACCSNFYLQFFVLFWNVQIKFRSLHFHWIQIFCGQVTYLYCSEDFIGRFIPWFYWGGNVYYIHHYNSEKYCKAVVSKHALKISEFQKENELYDSNRSWSSLLIICHFIGLFCKENKIHEKKSILCQWHIKMSITSK